ncbi:MAG: glyoxalase [Hyphomicrobiales bacterium]|nr:MAG: glyoxalase [Hyphomicrobiales bacterium]
MKDPFSRPKIRTGLFYHNPIAALDWIEKAFGFTRSMDIRDQHGELVHAEMTFGHASIIIDSEWSDFVASPLSNQGVNTQIIYVQLENDIEQHCEHARFCGAEIIQEPESQYYGDCVYRAKDIEGHVWTFSQAIRDIGKAEAEQLGEVKISGWHRD